MRGKVLMALVLAASACSVAEAQLVLSLTTAGAGSVIIPAGYDWTDVTVQCWGGGGGGGSYYIFDNGEVSGGGAGGGAYSSNTYATALVAGTYGYYIGAGGVGAGGGSDSGGSGSGGENTVWNYGGAQDIIAGGGGGGGGGGPGGGGGLVLAGTGYSGGGGGEAVSEDAGGGGGGSGGPSGPGGQGGDATGIVGGSGGAGYGAGGNGGGVGGPPGHSDNGDNGGFPGGGGGGTIYGFTAGQGGNGEIIITYTQQAVPEPSTLALLGVAVVMSAGYVFRRKLLMRRCFTFALTAVVSFLLFVNLAKTAQAQRPFEGEAEGQARIDEANRLHGTLAPSPEESAWGISRAKALDDAIGAEMESRQAAASAQAQRAVQARRAAWAAAPKDVDKDGKGFTQQLGNATRGMRDGGFSYIWVKDGDWEYYLDSSGVVGARYLDRAHAVTRFQYGVPANGSGTFRDVAVYQSGKVLFEHRLPASFAAKGCLIGGLTGWSGTSFNLKRGWPPPATKKETNRGGPGGMGFRQVGPYQVPNMAFGPNQ